MTSAAQVRDLVRARVQVLGYDLPAPLAAKGRYSAARLHGSTLWVSGHTGRGPSGARTVGTVGLDVTVERARDEARWAAVNLLGAVDGVAGLTAGLGDAQALLHLRVFVRAVPEFTEHPRVADAASELLLEALGPDVGRHARTAVGVTSLPGGAAVELEAVFACAS